ncbi:TIM23 complex subunit [Komagataella phaffii CBS 7435]|uniref:Mitochondrial import inner membrane translocase subunit TIM44 n=2 Tax=Komagataella phaffii TaxID=460519 RepID=C4R4V1_KOMPG|nr:Peripheral mitochondrial membrane protein involved in mitochondrial protein import [Komagataella phaffii GS115]AOA64298.1 GQ67_03611T0 [Komagataella phaffii]CAH2449651.1 TIM23 complex subunit [Komagataella phaffii CBS 7435]AOA68430.1 GQ68_03582T0 [Komagataella phaffii GS115]CAY70587.1 Peripheral mitochondrial membrane protein involved in mitochondrial protein import [Komagataella phaffii GS115]CCA39624.1 TIM23 complex subunit [Komagataella phaffii CBS 7435]
MFRIKVITRASRGFHSSGMAFNGPKSPMQVFFETFKNEWKKSDELKSNIKALQDETGRMAESEAFQKAKEAYDKAQKGSSFAGKAVKKTAETVGNAAVKAWDSPVGKVTRKTVKTTAEVVDKSFEPVRKTALYKEVSEVIDDGSSTRYGGFETKEQRRLRREKELSNPQRPKVIKANEEASRALVVTNYKPERPKLSDRFTFLKPETPIGKVLGDLRMRWEESENGLISLFRTIFEKIGGFFDETESAKVIRMFKEIDPSFNTENFNKQLREFIIPEVLEAYVQGDEAVLKTWLSEAPFNVFHAQQKQFKEQGLFSDGRILDIRGVDVLSAKVIPGNNSPALVIGARVQEVNVYRKAKTGEIAAGSPDNINLSTYVMVLTRIPEDVDHPETEGWKVLEFARGGTRQFT